MYLLEIEILLEATSPYLHEQRPIKVKKLVRLIVVHQVCLSGKVIGRGHARGSVDGGFGRVGAVRGADRVTIYIPIRFAILLTGQAEGFHGLEALAVGWQGYDAVWVVALCYRVHDLFICDEADEMLV